MKKYFIYLIIIFFPVGSWASCISGYSLIQSSVGVEMCANGNDVVQIIDLKKGARLKFLFEKDGNNFKQKYISSFWSTFQQTQSNAFSVVNGTFFSPDGSYESATTSQIAFLVKNNDQVATYGYDNPDDYWYRKVLKLEGSSASIDDDYSYSYINNFSQALGGLSTDANKNNWASWVGRNLIGINDNGDKIYILVTDGMSISSAKSTLNDFGATSLMMLDGSGSAQLRSEKKTIIGDDKGQGRLIPQAIGVVSGDASSLSYEEKCNFIFDILENKYSNYFSNGSSTQTVSSGHYRYYPVNNNGVYGSTNFLYAYNNDLWYKISGSWYQSSSIESWYSSLNQ